MTQAPRLPTLTKRPLPGECDQGAREGEKKAPVLWESPLGHLAWPTAVKYWFWLEWW